MIENVTQLNNELIARLTEDEIYDLLDRVIRPLNAIERTRYMDLLRTRFDFRSIQQTKNYLRKDMEAYGYKFFKIPNNDNMIMGIKRKP